jgi:hypothetical protein
MPQKTRIRNLSTRWLTAFKIFFLAMYCAIWMMFSYHFMFDGENDEFKPFGSIMAITYGFTFYLLIRMTLKAHRVEFDDEFLYVLKKNQDLIIPLQNIESVEIATVGGVYKVNLYHADQIGKEFYFKQSLWYPFNYKRCDALVNVLRKHIDLAKARVRTMPSNALHS